MTSPLISDADLALTTRAETHRKIGSGPLSHGRSHHLPQLDSVRGIAALVVVLGHFVSLWEPSSLAPHTRFLVRVLFHPLFNGRSSVTLFFLLSGFVLTLPYKRGRELPYPTFLLRRLARIYLPYLGALALALLGDWCLHQPSAAAAHVSSWFGQTWTAPLTPALLLGHLFLIGNYNTAQVNTAFWSLAVEMRLSILFPLLCLPLLRWSRSATSLILATLVLADSVLPRLLTGRMDPVSLNNLSDTSLGLFAFAAGILLARNLDRLQQLCAGLSYARRFLLSLVSFVSLEWLDKLGHTHLWAFANLLTISGGCGVLLLALSSRRASALLNHRLPAWLGRISYSLYLVHATVLFTLAHLFLGRCTRLQLLLPYLALSLGLAVLFFFLIEKPSIHFSRSIGDRAKAVPRRSEAPAIARAYSSS